MADILSKSGTVSITDLKDDWELTLEAGKKYYYEAKNTDNHGKYTFVIETHTLDYGDVPSTESYPNRVSYTLDPEDTDTGSFTALRSIYGLSSDDPEIQENIEKTSFTRVKVKWQVTIYDANYSIRIWQ